MLLLCPQGREAEFISAVVTKLVPLHASPQEYIVREGEVGSHLFFLWHGRMQVVYRTRTLRYMVAGSYFGDMAAFILSRHIVSYQAQDTCELYILAKVPPYSRSPFLSHARFCASA
jgi:CRP-like cAMP-binding protein